MQVRLSQPLLTRRYRDIALFPNLPKVADGDLGQPCDQDPILALIAIHRAKATAKSSAPPLKNCST
ncbi:hypothetical protein GFPCMMHI_06635 [Ensifer adhaerens]|nr:hypothetical protein [Ensifer adhaerens]